MSSIAGNKGSFLINTVSGGSGLDSSSNEFDVRNYARRITAAGLGEGDVVQVQTFAGSSDEGTWGDLIYDGKSVQLSLVASTQIVLVIEGRYRVTYEGASTTLQVWQEEDSIGLDQRSIASFPTMTNVGPAGPTGATGATGPAGADGADGVVLSIVAGTGITVDATDPANPIVSLST